MEVNKTRKISVNSREITELATAILLKWRDIVLEKSPSAKRPIDTTIEELQDKALEDKRPKSRAELAASSTREKPSTSLKTEPVVSSAQDLLRGYLVNDPIREKCFDMLITALTIDAPASKPDELVIHASRSIEECLFAEFGQVNVAYKAKFRSKYLNLKDRSNVNLRNAILSGVVSAERFCAMNAAEMASEERRKEDRKLMERNLQEAKAAQDNEAETDQFKCGRCGQRKAKYYQLQTRSADEPMTTFVTCINCGNRWKFC